MRSGSSRPAGRVPFVDVLRGLAVLLMLAWHTAEGWIEPALRDGTGWRVLRFLGGLGAPLFLLLAGVAVALQLGGADGRGVPRAEAVRVLVARGLTLVLLAYALRLQSWILDSLGILDPWGWRVWLPAGIGLFAGLVGCRRLDRLGAGPARPWLAVGAALLFGGIHQLAFVAPAHLPTALRVDILHCIGASLALVAWLGRSTGALDRPTVAVVLALVFGFATPLVWASLPSWLPTWASGYLGRTPSTVAPFPLFPWCAYPFLGLALGTLYRRAANGDRLGRVVVALGVFGALVALGTSESLPHGYRLKQEFPWLVQPLRVAFRAGLAMVLAAVAFAVAKHAVFLQRFGRTSLVVYWVHLTFAFGLASRPMHHRLDWRGWLVGAVLLCVVMYGVAMARLGPFETWRFRALHARPLSRFSALL